MEALKLFWFWQHSFIPCYFRYQTKYQIVLTKTDTVFPINVARRAMQIQEVNIVRTDCFFPLDLVLFYFLFF